MRLEKVRILIAVIAMWLIPFAIWGVLSIARNLYSANLRPLLSSVRVLRRVFWFVGASINLVGVVYDPLHWFIPIGVGIWGISSGLSFPNV